MLSNNELLEILEGIDDINEEPHNPALWEDETIAQVCEAYICALSDDELNELMITASDGEFATLFNPANTIVETMQGNVWACIRAEHGDYMETWHRTEHRYIGITDEQDAIELDNADRARGLV